MVFQGIAPCSFHGARTPSGRKEERSKPLSRSSEKSLHNSNLKSAEILQADFEVIVVLIKSSSGIPIPINSPGYLKSSRKTQHLKKIR